MADIKRPTYKQLQVALQAELDWFESADLDIDEALVRYKRAGELIEQMQAYLSSVKAGLEKPSPSKPKKKG